MKTHMPFILAAVFCVAALGSTRLLAADIGQLQRDFEKPPDDARIMVRWWLFGPAVTKPGLEREMKIMKESGVPSTLSPTSQSYCSWCRGKAKSRLREGKS